MKNIMCALIMTGFTTLIIGVIYFGFLIIKDYNVRMTQYNYHMCVEVYGLDENCK